MPKKSVSQKKSAYHVPMTSQLIGEVAVEEILQNFRNPIRSVENEE
jgi:hypothetical protein